MDSNEWLEQTKNRLKTAQQEGAELPAAWLAYADASRFGLQRRGEGSEPLHGGADWVTLDMGRGKWLARPVDGPVRTERGNLDDWRGAEFGVERLSEAETMLAEAGGQGTGLTAEDFAQPVLLLHDVFEAAALEAAYANDWPGFDVWPVVLAGKPQDVAARLRAAHVTQVLVLEERERALMLREGFDAGLVRYDGAEGVWDVLNGGGNGSARFLESVYSARARLEPCAEGVTLADVDKGFGVFKDTDEPVSSGFGALDKELNGGFAPRRLYLLVAAPSVGKTLFAVQVAEAAAETGVNVAYFSTEMSASELYARLISRRVHWQICARESGVYEERSGHSMAVTAYGAAKYHREEPGYLEQGRVDEQGVQFSFSRVLGSGVTEADLLTRAKFERMTHGMAREVRLAREHLLGLKGRVHIFENDDEDGMTLGTIGRNLRARLAREPGRWLVVVDFMGMLEVDDARLTDVQKATRIVRGLKNLARKLNVPILAISSAARANYGATGMATARDSGNTEFAADALLNLNFVDVLATDDDGGKKKAADASQGYARRDRRARRLDAVTHARLVALDIAKNRNSRTSNYVEFMQWPQFNDLLEQGLREVDY